MKMRSEKKTGTELKTPRNINMLPDDENSS